MKEKKNNIHGVVLLDKPTGMSSNKALQKVKHHFNAKKAGHTGSLDPLATGLLPICFGQATKISEYLLNSHKRYTTVIKLGEVTDTLDGDGEVVARAKVDVSDEQIEAALEKFKGKIKQVPPMYSALKKNGQPLYKLARKGEVIDRPARDMTVFELTASRIDETLVELKVHCSSGFYIRSLAHDLGQILGCGAHVHELRRTHIKSISLERSLPLDKVLESTVSDVLLPIDVMIADMPKKVISDEQRSSLKHGRKTPVEEPFETGFMRLYDENEQLFAIGEIDDKKHLKTKKIFVDI